MVQPAVRDSIQQIDENRWLIGGRISLIQGAENRPNSWADGKGSFFTISETPRPNTNSSGVHSFKKVYDASEMHVVWQIGEAFLKIVILESLDVTREHTTIEALHKMNLNFAVPRVLWYGEWDGRYYLVVSKVQGETINQLWPKMDETARSEIVQRISDICKDLSMMVSGQIGGIDGRDIPDRYLTIKNHQGDFNSPSALRYSLELGMDCSTFVFSHCDLGPTNVLLDVATDTVGVIDWECAGFVPKAWIRTKFRISGGYDLDNEEAMQNEALRYDYRRQMQLQLEKEGFEDYSTKWMKWAGYA